MTIEQPAGSSDILEAGACEIPITELRALASPTDAQKIFLEKSKDAPSTAVVIFHGGYYQLKR